MDKLLKTNLNDLFIASNNPELYIIQYFDEIKNQVDLFFTTKINNQTDDNESIDLKDKWLEIIDKIKDIESEILRKQNYLHIDQNSYDHIKSIVHKYELEFNCLSKSKRTKKCEKEKIK